ASSARPRIRRKFAPPPSGCASEPPARYRETPRVPCSCCPRRRRVTSSSCGDGSSGRPAVVGSLSPMRGFLALVFVVAPCRGSSDSPPGPLSTHFDQMYIAAIPLDQQKDVVDTQQQFNIARMENANAESQVKESDSQLHQARNDQKATRLAIDSAVSAKKSAD